MGRKLDVFWLFAIHRCDSGHLDIGLSCFPNANWGWEYGPNNGLEADVLLCVKVKGLNVLWLDFWRWGFDIRAMGFWWIV